MRERNVATDPPTPWHVPAAVEEIAETGRHFDLVADKDVRANVAKIAGLRDLPRFAASFDVTRHGAGGLHVVGRISATVGQSCVVTLEPVANEVEEEIDLLFVPPRPVERKAAAAAAAAALQAKPEKRGSERARNEPEPLLGGMVDLGALATEFLILGLDPYPRSPGAVFEPPQEVTPDDGPFAALARLTKGRDGH
jgi:hypothetical protein